MPPHQVTTRGKYGARPITVTSRHPSAEVTGLEPAESYLVSVVAEADGVQGQRGLDVEVG